MSLKAWLRSITTAESIDYRHQMLSESAAARDAGLSDLQEKVREAHRDFSEHFGALLMNDLHPFAAPQPLAGYPGRLPMQTLKGYFGELMAGIVAEEYQPFAMSWKVPAYLFRFDRDALHWLMRINSDPNSQQGRVIPGRRGDDCIAFLRDEEGIISAILVCEAKCTAGHESSLIARGHDKLSDNGAIVDLLALIEILKDRDDDESKQWKDAIERVSLASPDNYERRNLLVYVCGRTHRSGRPWISATRPHKRYTADKPLEAAEVHIQGVEQVIGFVYERND